MINFYEEFNLDPNLSTEELGKSLNQEKKKWILRQNAPNLEQRQKAENKLQLIEDAVRVFRNNLEREKYDLKLKRTTSKQNNSQQTQKQTKQQDENLTNQEQNNNLESLISNATQLYNNGNIDQAIKVCINAINKGFKNGEFYNILGLCYSDKGSFEKSISHLQKALQLAPNNSIIYANIASTCLNFNRIKGSIPYIEKALQLDPTNPFIKYLDILRKFYSGEVDLAESEIKEHLKNNPNDNEYRERIAYAYIRYSDEFLVYLENGSDYIPDEKSFSSIRYYREQAYNIFSSPNTKYAFEKILSLEKKRFNTDNIKGLILLVLIAFTALTSSPIGILALMGAIYLAYWSYQPGWIIDKMNNAGVKSLPGITINIFNKIIMILDQIFIIIMKIFLSFIS